MSVCCQVSRGSQLLEEPEQNVGVAISGGDNINRRNGKPLLYAFDRRRAGYIGFTIIPRCVMTRIKAENAS